MTMRAPLPKLLLFNPPTGLYRRDDRCQCTVEDQTVQIVFPPNELAMAAALAEREGANCRIEDYPAAGRGWDAFEADLKEFQPAALVVSSTTATLAGDLETCRMARKLNPDIVTMAKGETLIVNAATLLRDHPEVDIVLPNEGEEAVAEIVAGKPFCEIPGLHFRRDLLDRFGEQPAESLVLPMGKSQVSAVRARAEEREGATATALAEAPESAVYFTGKRTLQANLDSLPFPARHLLRNELYRSPETGNPLAVIHGNRGCPAKCIYCPAGVLTDFSVRHRSPANILAELEECVNRYGLREFLFHGDTFTINKKWLLELCQGIRDRRLNIHWGCNSRVDTIDDERAAAMKAAGCWVVAFGIESGDDEMLVKMKKNATTDQARNAIAVCKRNGLRTHAFMVIGLPWETRETLQKTFDFARELNTDFFDFNIATPLPGTELHEIALREDLFAEGYDPARAGYATGALKTMTGLTPAELVEWRRKHLLKLYLRPGYVARILAKAGSPKNTLQYLKAGTKRLGQLVRPRKS